MNILPGINDLLLKQAFAEAKIKLARRSGKPHLTNNDVMNIMGLGTHETMITKVFSGTRSERTLIAILQFIIYADPRLLPEAATHWLKEKEQPATPDTIQEIISIPVQPQGSAAPASTQPTQS